MAGEEARISRKSIRESDAKITHRLALANAVLDVALEYHTIGLGESERLVVGLERVALGGRLELGEDGVVDGAAVVVDDLEGGPALLGHGDAGAREDAVRRVVGDLDAEGEPVADAHRARLVAVQSHDADLGQRRVRAGRDADGLLVPVVHVHGEHVPASVFNWRG